MPAVGSSSSTSRLPPMNAIATLSFRFCPPDSISEYTSFLSTRSTFASIRSTSPSTFADGTPFSAAKNRRCSAHVSPLHRMLCCGQKPISDRTSRSWSRTDFPYTVQSPSDTDSIPVIMFIVVVLPAPLCPSSTVIWFGNSFSSRSSTATFATPLSPANSLRSPWMCTL